jgi:hypothetical protein
LADGLAAIQEEVGAEGALHAVDAAAGAKGAGVDGAQEEGAAGCIKRGHVRSQNWLIALLMVEMLNRGFFGDVPAIYETAAGRLLHACPAKS